MLNLSSKNSLFKWKGTGDILVCRNTGVSYKSYNRNCIDSSAAFFSCHPYYTL